MADPNTNPSNYSNTSLDGQGVGVGIEVGLGLMRQMRMETEVGFWLALR